jgi:L-alanine-DL-glutamate epimerase-like enolase superfamily enzyme
VTEIRRLTAKKLNCTLKESFDIAGGGQQRAENILIEVILSDGIRGYGESAPFPDFNGETQASTLAAIRRLAPNVLGKGINQLGEIVKDLKKTRPAVGAARAGIEMALLDAWSKHNKAPLHIFFGGASRRIITDVTIPIVSPEHAEASARKWKKFGISTLKIKIGRNPEKDFDRIRAVKAGHPKAKLILDANAGYDADTALNLLARLKAHRMKPALFEQPVGTKDLPGMKKVSAKGGVPVAADESVSSSKDVLRIAQTRAAHYVNIKIMKSGVFESLAIARTARSAGLGLMIGGLVESRLAMSCSAHLAAGFGSFDFIDLDTPLFFSQDPMRGLRIRPGGVYDLSRVRSGLGVSPKFGIIS